MTRTARSLDVLSLASLGAVVAFTASVYDALPARMATHFSLHGTPNGWMDRPYATWGFDAFALLIWAGVRFSPRWLPKQGGWRARADQSPTGALATLMVVLLAALSAFMVWNALHPETSRGATLTVLLGAYALVYSAILPRVRRNPMLGVRTPFSLTSDENWHRTNRFASYTFAAGGIACIACGLARLPAVGISFFLVAALAPWLYSWALAYKLPPET